jgi:protein TonB
LTGKSEVLEKMGKILKYCGSCEEGFAERFTFCPDCGASLQAVQLNPVADEIKAETVEPAAPAFIAEEPETITAPFMMEPEMAEVEEYSLEAAPVTEALDKDFTEYEAAGYETGPLESPEATDDIPPVVTASASGSFFTAPEMHADEPRSASAAPTYERADDGGYYVTVIQETNSKQRNMLLLGSTAFILVAAMVLTVVSLFSKDLNVGSIDDSPLFSAVLFDEIPMVVEEEEEQKKADDEDGGGGGGGREEKTPASRGDLPDMTKNPVRSPDVHVPRFDNFELKTPPPQIQGPEKKFDKKYGQWGDPNGLDGPPSNGPGTGGGIGSGSGTGVGSGSGTGAGSGSGSGLGSGAGSGIGGGTGGGAPPDIKAPVTENYRITSTPKATYTEEGRKNNVQGSVRLRITLLASGQVGSVTPVTRLPNGLTEQAIAAAKRISFTPKKVNGVAQSVIITRDYTFTIY